MKKISLILISILSGMILSCARGGDDSSGNNKAQPNNPSAGANGSPSVTTEKIPSDVQNKFPNKNGTAFGMWMNKDQGLRFFLTEQKARLEAICDTKSVNLEFMVQVTPTTIKTLDAKKVGDKDCSIEVKKNDIITYRLNGDQLVLSYPGQEDLILTRIQNAPPVSASPQPSNPSQNPQPSQPLPSLPGGQQPEPMPGNSQPTMNFEFYSGNQCTGAKIVYSPNMKCQGLALNVQSVAIPGEPCQNLDEAISAQELCFILNKQFGN